MFQFPFLGLARLSAYSHKCPLLHPVSIRVLKLIYSLQHISHTLKSYIDRCVHTCTHVGMVYL